MHSYSDPDFVVYSSSEISQMQRMDYPYDGEFVRKRSKLLSLGLPLGSALVLIALLNTVFTLEAILNFSEILLITGNFTARNHLLYFVVVTASLLLTVYFWVFVIFTGRGYHLSIWIAGTLLLLLMKIVISSWTLLFYLSVRDALYWRKLWTLGIDIVLEIYIISICVVAANAMWKGDDSRRYLRHSDCSNISISQDETTMSTSLPYVPIPPVGYGPRRLVEYFYLMDLKVGTKVWVLLDVIFSMYILSTEKIPELLTRGWNNDLNAGGVELNTPAEEPTSVFWFGLSKFGHARLSLIFFEDTLLRVCRIIVGLLILLLVLNQRTDPKKLRYMLMANIVLLTVSILIYFILFGLFEDLSITDHFYQVEFTGDILLRFILIGFLTKYVESRRLEELGSNFINNNHFNETTN